MPASLAPFATFADGSEANVSGTSSLGFPSPVWFIQLDWVQTAPVVIEVPVIAAPDDPGDPVLYTIFLAAKNTTPDDWAGFSVGVEGPADIGLFPVPNLAGLFPATLVPSGSDGFSFEGLDWPSPTPEATTDLSVFINFGLDIVPPEAGEPMRLTLAPAAVPEPGTALLVGFGALLGLMRRPFSAA